MMRIAAAALAVILFSEPSVAQRTRLDDSLSPMQTFAVELAVSSADMTRAFQALLAGSQEAMPAATGLVPNVEVRLDTRAYVGRAVRMYLSLPLSSGGQSGAAGLVLRWDASEGFLPGEVRPGQATLVFEGLVSEPVTSAVFDFVLALENGVADPFVVEPVYEIELAP